MEVLISNDLIDIDLFDSTNQLIEKKQTKLKEKKDEITFVDLNCARSSYEIIKIRLYRRILINIEKSSSLFLPNARLNFPSSLC